MSTVQELKKRADELRNKTAVNSITPDEVGSLIFDTIDYMYSIESSGIFKMMSSLADTTNPSAADQIPVIGAEIAQKASITTVVGKGLQNAETQTELDSVPVIRGTKVGQMAKSDIAVKLCESFEQNLPTYRPNTDTFDQIRIRKSETGESYYISKEDLAEVVGGLIGTVTSSKNGLVDRYSDMYCRDDIPQDLNDSFAGFGRADNRKNAPASYGMVISFYTRTKGNYICAQFFISDIGTIYGRMKWESWLPWKQLT